ncbi:hypothetical protein N7509_012016 [Penicillium cosmopolitanum]|uniref:Uncharacterized protein n=1 Tax=Penicillium cosmopolitanum TaxID=1131564 RepID=A0A9W9VED1_9EURO|nr:uncharacterized protein N7509_012016 [Penicillium cosmopolitanum]KAJ5378897.1 hypothetical protein N7509_012016 [Penicillium cosmopolitanum]
MSWLSQKDLPKAYGSMVVALTQRVYWKANTSTRMESRPSPVSSSPGVDRCSASVVWVSGTKPFRARKRSFVAAVLSQATAIVKAKQRNLGVQSATGLTSRLAASVVLSTR